MKFHSIYIQNVSTFLLVLLSSLQREAKPFHVIIGQPPSDKVVTPRISLHASTPMHNDNIDLPEGEGDNGILNSPLQTRRVALSTLIAETTASAFATTVCLSAAQLPQQANAADDVSVDDFKFMAKKCLAKLRTVPTFCIVNKDGIPFALYKEGQAIGYFFLSFKGAMVVLDDARKRDTDGTWTGATVQTVPLDVAMQLALRPFPRVAINVKNKEYRTTHELVSSERGLVDAKMTDKQKSVSVDRVINRWEKKNRVPIFYVNELELPGTKQQPRFFNRAEVLVEWKKQNPNETNPPPIEVVELVNLFEEAFVTRNLEKIQDLAFIPNEESNQIAEDLKRNFPPSSLNMKEIILAGSA